MPEISTAPRERPILFSGPMVRAILEGRKTVTRRVVKGEFDAISPSGIRYKKNASRSRMANPCPYGQPGDRLWVRESWWQAGDWQPTYPDDDTGSWFGSQRVVYSADGLPPNEPNRHYLNGLRNGAYSAADPHVIWRHRPSIHMPRWASRILLEITAVHVERLQDISEEQALAEGAVPEPCDHARLACKEIDCWGDTAKGTFGFLWETINGTGSWATNPWVWVVEFKRVAP